MRPPKKSTLLSWSRLMSKKNTHFFYRPSSTRLCALESAEKIPYVETAASKAMSTEKMDRNVIATAAVPE